MPLILRNALAVLVGIFLGSLVNMAIITVGPMLIPLPEGVDLSDMEKIRENMKLLAPANFISPWAAHAAGTFVGAFIAAKLAASHRMKLAIGIGLWFLLGGIIMLWLVGGPIWFGVLDLVGAYLPMAYFGGTLAASSKSTAE